ncbi:MAG: hypothetical protein P4L39_00010 [Humidesulfovibrio sp.]|nr:hypothetical protein [Humidesulfovibrio sp.]
MTASDTTGSWKDGYAIRRMTRPELDMAIALAAPQGPVSLDVPMSNAGAVRLAESHGMRQIFETGRMYRGPAPEYDQGRVFGVTSFELG